MKSFFQFMSEQTASPELQKAFSDLAQKVQDSIEKTNKNNQNSNSNSNVNNTNINNNTNNNQSGQNQNNQTKIDPKILTQAITNLLTKGKI